MMHLQHLQHSLACTEQQRLTWPRKQIGARTEKGTEYYGSTVCNTTPLLRINFQEIEQHKQSNRRRGTDIAEQLQEIEMGDAA